jgi:peroxiredoxin Q/BCP
MASPEPGSKAPDFDLPTDDGRVSLASLKGRTVVLYFYPKDDTSGCTAEAQAFTAAAGEFEKAGAAVVGVSKDSVKRHANFRAKYDLAVTLASDESGETIERYGVWIEKSMYGRKYMGIERATFLIDAQGVVRQVWRKVKVPGHASEVLTAVKTLNG